MLWRPCSRHSAAPSQPRRPRADRGPVRRLGPGPARRDRRWRAAGRTPATFDQAAVESACDEAVGLVVEYTRLTPAGPIPRPELDRPGRVGAGRPANAQRALGRARGAHRRRLQLPGPLGGIARSLAGARRGSRGRSRRRLRGAQGPRPVRHRARPTPIARQRLLFVGPEPRRPHLQLGETPELFLRWIAIHETTHAVQFTSVPWLRAHLAGLLEELHRRRRRRGWTARRSQGLAKRLLSHRPAQDDPRRCCRASSRGCSRGPSRRRCSTASRRRCP